MKIYTRKGDRGKTSLLGGDIVNKDDSRVIAYGTIDELNSFLGLARSFSRNDKISEIIKSIQIKLFDIGNIVATLPEKRKKSCITKEDIEWLEKKIDEIEENLPTIKNFIIPGNGKLSSILHICRTVARRAERTVVAVRNSSRDEELDIVISYLNRVSDLFFVLARFADKSEGIKEELLI